MEKKPQKPMPMPPVPKPMPKYPMTPGYPTAPHPYVPCDKKMLRHLYHHLKMCHRHEIEMLKMMMRYCRHRKRRSCHESPRYYESPSPYRKHNPCNPYESPRRHRNNPHRESSSPYESPYDSPYDR